MSLVHLNFYSQYLKGNTNVNIVLPSVNPFGKPDFDIICQEKKYPVLWLLHGTYGDYSTWVRSSNIERYANEAGIIVVMPDALNSGYSNWPCFGLGYQMSDYLTQELMPLIRCWFPVSKLAHHNFIGGYSAGGYGAMKYGFENPDLFGGMIILSAPPYDISQYHPDEDSPDYIRVRNEKNNVGNLKQYYNSFHNPAWAVNEFVRSGKTLKLYFAIGKSDFLYSKHIEFLELAKKVGLKAIVEAYGGYAHGFVFWDFAIQKGIKQIIIEEDNDERSAE